MSNIYKRMTLTTVNKIFPDMEVTIGDDISVWNTIIWALSERQGEIIRAMSQGSDLIQVYCPVRQRALWDMTGLKGIIPHNASVKVLVRRGIIIPTISDKEWKIQIALGSIDERIWKVNPVILESLQYSSCLYRTIQERLETGGKFNVSM